jgi:hypothetical protein
MKSLLPLLCLLFACAVGAAPPLTAGSGDAVPWTVAAGTWRTDAAWYDGLAEKCVYDGTRTIYGTERRFVATAYTNKQVMDAELGVKAAGSTGVEVLKHHWSERVPTENYDYDFSTASFTRTADLAPFKLAVATQEDCGASFKQVRRSGEELRYLASVYHPGAGTLEGALAADGVHFEDALTLLLRDFPFADGGEHALRLIPSQKDARAVPFEPRRFTVRAAGRETLTLPVGEVLAERLELLDAKGAVRARYWFATETAAPWLRALVRYEGPSGVTYRLRSIERTAYWERG